MAFHLHDGVGSGLYKYIKELRTCVMHSKCAPGSVKQHSSLHNVIMERGGELLGELLNAQKVCLNKLPLFFKNIDRIFRQCNNFINQAKMKRENQVNVILWQEIVSTWCHNGRVLFLPGYSSCCLCVCVASSLYCELLSTYAKLDKCEEIKC